ncbi:hypothetical protein CFP56_010720 [Quercus suber]|uniref:Uncharacterized protein n=1 Tax=Quercus suber TaxID=58331 RepID=A0AAW0L0I4_QUESU
MKFVQSHKLPVDSVSISTLFKDSSENLEMSIQVFLFGQNQEYTKSKKQSSIGIIIGAAISGTVLLLLLLLAGFYAFHQKRRAERASGIYSLSHHTNATRWDPKNGSGGVPQLKGARCFYFEELKKYTKKHQCNVALSSKPRLNFCQGFIIRILSALLFFVLIKVNKCLYMNVFQIDP